MFENLEKIFANYADLVDFGEPQSEEEIVKAENDLSVIFPVCYREYLSKWGSISFGPHEYFGLGTKINNVVRHTIEKRKIFNFPSYLVVICDRDGDEYICIDSQDNFKIVAWDVPTRTISRVRSDNFENFLTSDVLDIIE